MIKVEGVKKSYTRILKREGFLGNIKDLFFSEKQEVDAVNDLTFDIKKGEIVGYIGENGAGKSTTIKLIAGILRADAGRIEVGGVNINKRNKRFYKKIGVMFGQKSQLWWDIAVIESYKMLSIIYDVPEETFRDRVSIICEYLDIEDLLNIPVRKLSLGQRVLCDFAALFIYNPPLIILDEPTIGLDVLVKKKIHDFIVFLSKNYETTILLTTHDLHEIEQLCSRILILDKGSLVYDGSLRQLKEQTSALGRIQFEFLNDISVEIIHEAIGEMSIEIFSNTNNIVTVSYNSQIYSRNTVINKVISKFEIIDIRVLDMSINSLVEQMLLQDTVYHGGTK